MNRLTRTIRFPAVINMREGLLEFVIVHDKGKVHESLLRTAINAGLPCVVQLMVSGDARLLLAGQLILRALQSVACSGVGLMP